MPWVRLDDRFPSHRKVALLSDRAFRLHVSALCWSSENLTEGKILDSELRVIANVRGIKAAAKELEDRQLWDRVDDGWVIHDFLEYNPDRVKVKKQRENNAARQQAFRDRKRAEREAKKAAEEASRNAPRNAVTGGAPATGTRHEDDTKTRENRAVNPSTPQVNGIRNAVSNGTPCPTPSTSYGSTAARRGGEQGASITALIPDWAKELVDELGAEGISVNWRLGDMQWAAVQELINTRGVPFLVEQARRRWNPKDPIKFASLLIQIWAEIPAPPARRPSARESDRPLPPWCKDPDCDERTRLRDVEVGNGLWASKPCPQCHPSRKEPAA